MRLIMRLAAMFFVLIAVGCAATPATVQRDGAAFAADEPVGTWSLGDDENITFDVRLSPAGTAVSNWSKGPASAEGESGRWTVDGSRIVIDYTDGWRDVIVRTPAGRYRKESYAPRAPRDGAPTNEGLAVRTSPALAKWVGVYRVPVAESRTAREFHVSIQSTHAAWKSIDEVRVGSWWISGEALRVRWANGWLDELRFVGPGYQVRSWKPGTALDTAGNPVGAPTNTGTAHRLD